ncbi:hypothetical protein DIKCMJMK_01708 [Shewanella oneidensis]|nr:hypothetical protein [Shewanella oneidensis]
MFSEFISSFISDSTVKAAVITAVLAFSGSLFVAFFSRAQKVSLNGTPIVKFCE